ncbi:MAG TPA: hypothetical protein VJT49_18810 [Amycolatopsis sp.]|uniref:hypothetical protein n=1 Tax=Amycolatopsis sp. TaxID=37632 RepID=UPI002B464E3F|nr:hypothetical protein [Amycolatopsis sp.]HKS47118.1 hypothetical protein [Amycolatopsis sp.]
MKHRASRRSARLALGLLGTAATAGLLWICLNALAAAPASAAPTGHTPNPAPKPVARVVSANRSPAKPAKPVTAKQPSGVQAAVSVVSAKAKTQQGTKRPTVNHYVAPVKAPVKPTSSVKPSSLTQAAAKAVSAKPKAPLVTRQPTVTHLGTMQPDCPPKKPKKKPEKPEKPQKPGIPKQSVTSTPNPDEQANTPKPTNPPKQPVPDQPVKQGHPPLPPKPVKPTPTPAPKPVKPAPKPVRKTGTTSGNNVDYSGVSGSVYREFGGGGEIGGYTKNGQKHVVVSGEVGVGYGESFDITHKKPDAGVYVQGQAKASFGVGGLEFKVTGGPVGGDWATKASVSGKILGLNIAQGSITLADKNGFLNDGKWDWGLSKISAKDWTKALQGGFKPKVPPSIEIKGGLVGTADTPVPSWVPVPSF